MQEQFEHIYTSPIGRIKITADNDCIQTILFLEEQDQSVNKLENESPPVIHQCIDELIEYFNGSRTKFTVPIHQSGTDFQQKV